MCQAAGRLHVEGSGGRGGSPAVALRLRQVQAVRRWSDRDRYGNRFAVTTAEAWVLSWDREVLDGRGELASLGRFEGEVTVRLAVVLQAVRGGAEADPEASS